MLTIALAKQEEVEQEPGHTEQELEVDVPVVDAEDNPSLYAELKEKLYNLIVSNRIVQEDKLKYLFEKTKEANQVDPEKYDEVVEEIKQEVGYLTEEGEANSEQNKT